MADFVDRLYNEERKMAHIDRFYRTKDSKRLAEAFFRRIGAYEYEFNLDLCEMSVEIMETILNKLAFGSSTHRYSTMCYINRYCKWCVGKRFPNAHNIIKKCYIDDIDQFRKKMVANPAHLEQILDKTLANPDDRFTTNDIAKMYLWFAYMGLPESEAALLTSENIDLKTMTVHVGSNQYPIYRECLKLLDNCINCDTVYIYINDKAVAKERSPGNRIVRSFPPNRKTTLDDNDEEIIILRTKKSFINMKSGLTYRAVRMSGVFRRLYESNAVDPATDPYSIFSSFIMGDMNKEVLSRYDDNLKGLRKHLKARCRNMFEDYSRWLIAFGL